MSRFFYRVFFIILMVPVFIFADDNLMPGEKVHVWVLGEPDLTLAPAMRQN
ncbi:hypothetical protein HYY75_00815 [bacterium]|nr:hypothetical protein [bacterium]